MVRKFISVLSLSLFVSLGLANGQVEMAGFPWSATQSNLQLHVPEYNYPATDNSEAIAKQGPGPYLVATAVPVHIQFPESSTMYKLDNGNMIWKVKLTIDEAKGVGTYLDRFHLPAGVSMYITNSNGRHIMGPFTEQDNSEDGRLPIDAIQGEVAYVELNIDAGVNVDEIDFHIYKLASYFRGVSDLEYYSDEYTYGEIDWYDESAFNGSSKCMINANCPQGEGYDFAKNATVKEVIPAGGGYFGNCSGTLVNRLGNEPGANCKRYLLTATHCEGTNSTSDASVPFSEWITKFNYQSPTCENPAVAPVSNNLNGVKFLARDPYSESAGVEDLNADFLLLEITKPAPSPISGSAVMVGFDRRASHPKAYLLPKRFIFFHHPSGDMKKTSYSKTITDAVDYYWGTQYFEGFAAQGSSGSGMFDDDQKVMGVASIATFGPDAAPDSCLTSASGLTVDASNQLYYAKVSYCWENPSLSSPTDAQKLKPWLDPHNTGAEISPTVDWFCNPVSSVSDLELSFGGDFNIYPNPSTDGNFQMNIRMNQASYAQVQVYDITGKVILSRDLGKLQSQIVNLDLTQLTGGMYMVRISNQYGQITRKVVINK